MEELAPERRAIKDALDDLRIDAWVYESDAGARSQSIRQTYVQELEGADLYIGIFWKAYGEYTVDEYRLAATRGKDRLIFQKRTASEGERDPKLRDFLASLNNVEKGLTVQWFDGLEGIAKLVKDDVAGWQSDIILERTSANPDFALQAPPLPDQYIARQVVGHLKQALLDHTPPVTRAALNGMGGLGKTVTAAAFARDPEVLAHFPDGVLWVTLAKFPDLKQRLADWGGALNDAQVLKSPYPDVQTGTGRLRTLLNDKACLLVVDDAWKASDVTPFLVGGPCCLLLLTTRLGEVADSIGATKCPLDFMMFDEALALMRRWVGDIVAQDAPIAQRIAEELGGVPQAIELAASQVKRLGSWAGFEQRWNSRKLEALKRGRSAATKEDNLALSLELSFDQLAEEDRHRFDLLAAVPEDASIPTWVAAALWKIDDTHAEDLLVDLADQALISRTDGGFGIHDLISDLLRQHLGDEGLRKAHNQMADAIQLRADGAAERDQYVRQRLGYHLEGAGRHEELYTLVATKPDWAQGCYRAEGTYTRYAIDLKRAWNWASAQNWDAARQVRCAMIEASTRSLAGQSSPELFVRAVTEGHLGIDVALQEVSRMPKSFEKSRGIEKLAPLIPTTLLPQAVNIARDIREARFRAQALLAIGPRLPFTLRTEICREVLGDLPTIESSFLPNLVYGVGQILPAEMKTQAIDVSLNALDPGKALRALAHARHGELDRDILDAVVRIEDLGKRSQILPALALALSRDLLDEVISAARSIGDAGARTDALVGLVRLLGERAPSGLAEDALDAVRSFQDTDAFAYVGSQLLPALPAQWKPEVLRAAEAFADKIEEPAHRAEFLTGLAAQAVGDDRARISRKGLAAAKHVPTERDRVKALAAMAPILPHADRTALELEVNNLVNRDQRIALLSLMPPQPGAADRDRQARSLLIELAKANNSFHRITAWEHATPWLSDDELAEGAAIVLREPDQGGRNWELAKIFESLPEARRVALLARFGLLDDYRRNHANPRSDMKLLTWFALSQPNLRPAVPIESELARAHIIDDLSERGQLLARFCEYVPPERRAEVLNEGLAVARAIDHDIRGTKFAWSRSHVLVALALRTDGAELETVLREIENVPDIEARASAQARVAGRVPSASREQLVDGVLAAIRLGGSDYTRRDILAEVAPHLSERAALEALAIARTIETAETRAFALADVLPHLPETERSVVIGEAIDASMHAGFASNRNLILMRLLQGAPPLCRCDLLAQAQAALADMDALDQRIGAIFTLAQYLPDEQRPELYQAAWNIAGELNPVLAIPVLLANAKYLSLETLKALTAEGARIALAMPKGRQRCELLVVVADNMPPGERPPLLKEALDSALIVETISGLERTSVLNRIFTLWKNAGFADPNDGPARLSSILTALGANRRGEFLNDLAAVLPLISHLGGAPAVAGAYEAVCDISRWWP